MFSPRELQQLVLGEVERAERQGYSLGCLRVAVDRLDSLQDIYGREARREIVRSLVEFLARDLRGSDFIGHLADGSLLCLLPQATPEGLQGVGGRLLRGARSLVFQSGNKQVHITTSIGIAHAAPGDAGALEVLKASADAGLTRSAAAGGDRLLEVCLAAEERDQALKEEAERERRAHEARQAAAPASTAASNHGSPQIGDSQPGSVPVDPSMLLAMVRQALSEHSGAIAEVERRRSSPEPSGADRGQVEVLERRVSKLAAELERYQDLLLKVSAAGPDDEGVRSLGKLAGRETNMNTTKLDMMGEIFKANLALKNALASTPKAGPPEGEPGENSTNPPPPAP